MKCNYTCVVCDTAKVRFFKQITTATSIQLQQCQLFAILQKYDFSSKSQPLVNFKLTSYCCLRYCKSTIFQANHNTIKANARRIDVVCDTAKVRFFKQITTINARDFMRTLLFAILQKYDFSSKSQHLCAACHQVGSCLRYCKSTIFQANHNEGVVDQAKLMLFAILQKYDFSSKSQLVDYDLRNILSCLRYCKSTIFQANHNRSYRSIISLTVVCDTAKVRFFKQITTRRYNQ